ncbi:MAG: MMPL family transporter [bacterium]
MLSLEGLDGQPPVVSGKPMIWADVLIAMEEDGIKTTVASLLTVVLLLLLFERSVRGTLLILVPLTLAIGFTAGVMALLGIKLNFFNMLALPTVIGMGVDDGVHLYHRHKELGRDSARYVVRTTGSSAVLTTVTTAIGFGSLLLANHQGLNSLGLLAMIGMAAALFATLVVLPAAMQWSDDILRRRDEKAAK